MKIGIMQPYFFPYIGYFSLINYVDKFIFFDTPQYISHGWVNRNRILKQNGTVGYITVPVKKMPQQTTIKDILIADNIDWRARIYGQLTAYKRKAPYYREVIGFIHSILNERQSNKLSDLNIAGIRAISLYLGLEDKFEIFSQMDINISQVEQPDEWALKITKAISGDIYVNPPGGESFFDRNKNKKQGIKLEILQ